MQAPIQVIEQGEGAALNVLHRVGIEHLRPLHPFLHQGLTGAQQHGGRWHASQLQGANALVQVLPGRAQQCGVQRIQIRAFGRRIFLERSVQGLVRSLQGLANFVMHPGQGPQVISGKRVADVAGWSTRFGSGGSGPNWRHRLGLWGLVHERNES